MTSVDPTLAPFLSTVPDRRWHRRIAGTIVVLSLVAFGFAVPFAGTPWPKVPAFIPAYESALILNDLITAVLLIGQFRQLRAPSLLVLGSGYLFDAFVITAHLLSFPGVFGPSGLLGGNEQTTPWLYVFWHGIFPLYVIVYALLAHRRSDRPLARPDSGIALGIGVLVAAVLAGGATLLATAGIDRLPPLIEGGDY